MEQSREVDLSKGTKVTLGLMVTLLSLGVAIAGYVASLQRGALAFQSDTVRWQDRIEHKIEMLESDSTFRRSEILRVLEVTRAELDTVRLQAETAAANRWTFQDMVMYMQLCAALNDDVNFPTPQKE